MNAGFASGTTETGKEIAMLRALRVNIVKGYAEARRGDENRLLFRVTQRGCEYAERMRKEK